jgi:hypothetical protein
LIGGTVETSAAGNGGSGSAGQTGQNGGAGGKGGNNACSGGRGGKGGAGGGGGGGAGGVSIGIIADSTSAVSDAKTTFMLGEPGDGGKGAGVHNDGIPGIAENQMTMPPDPVLNAAVPVTSTIP